MEKRSKVWSEDDVSFLKQNYSTQGASYCAYKLDRTIEAIANKARRLNLKRDGKYRYNKPDCPKGYTYCCLCKQILPDSYFYNKKQNGSYGKKCNGCRSCCQRIARRSYRKHKSSNLKRIHSTPEKTIYNRLKAKCKKKNIIFTITIDDIKIPSKCPVLGIDIILFSGSDNSPSVDRLVPELGYIKGNINIISNKANRIKNNSTPEELELVLFWYRKKIKEAGVQVKN